MPHSAKALRMEGNKLICVANFFRATQKIVCTGAPSFVEVRFLCLLTLGVGKWIVTREVGQRIS